jgi:beta-glucosidase
MACGQHCAGTARLDDVLAQPAASSWRTLGIPLKCFGQSGADMTQIRTALALSTAGTLDIAVQRVALGTEADQKVACTS